MTDSTITAYDFVELGEGLAETLTRAAEEQVERAVQILEQTKAMAEIIRTQVQAQATQIAEMNERFNAFGVHMLDAHRLLNGEQVPAAGERDAGGAADRGGAVSPITAAAPGDIPHPPRRRPVQGANGSGELHRPVGADRSDSRGA